MTQTWDEAAALELVRKSVLRELPPGVSLPSDEDDLVVTGLIDSMGWVGILSAIEAATGIRSFGSVWSEGTPQSIRTLTGMIVESTGQARQEAAHEKSAGKAGLPARVSILGWGYSLGSLTVEADTIERECGLSLGMMREGAGIETVRRVSEEEDELTLGQRAVAEALAQSHLDMEAVDFLVATSTTFLEFPSLAAALHTRLLLSDSCGAIDIGGACAGIVHALAAARAFLLTGQYKVGLVVACEVHSRRLASSSFPGEFRGLFGDGACAFVLGHSDQGDDGRPLALGDTVWGCSGAFASSLRLALREGGEIAVNFEGKQLAAAAITHLNLVFETLERQSGKLRSEVDYFALHQPNPRVIEILAQRAEIPLERIPNVSRTCGNLGSATCGVSLCQALTNLAQSPASSTSHPLIFLAAVAPGLIWSGTFLY
jgi:3-oxoacyl-[acyl-carrier-protein] synthase-3